MTATMSSAVNGREPITGESAIRRRSARAIKVYWPVSHETYASLGAGDVEALWSDKSFAPLLRVLESSPALGDFGLYRDVFELSTGVEGFTAAPGAMPALGAVGDRSLSPTVAFTTYIDARTGDDEVHRVLAHIVAAHPWEVPVIELSAPFELISRR
ncbi:hypothetical protein [Nonomuraea sp. 10N515B]|uniref:hypothetical protein n=1 Tax=Nonomuraea sp. 10N515B TaxID=3457422 RepID=UPI003FCDAC7D